MPVDLTDIAMIGAGLLSLGITVLVLSWPGADGDDVMRRVRGDGSEAR